MRRSWQGVHQARVQLTTDNVQAKILATPQLNANKRLILGRYAIALLTVITSIGYNFGVSEVPISTIITLAPEDIVLRLPPVDGFQNGTLSP